MGSYNRKEIIHDEYFNKLRKNEFTRLSKSGHIYLDYTGGNIYSESQVRRHQEMLLENVFGNPHSTNPTSQLATKLTDEARNSVLKFFNAEDYHCIFTQNATGALQIVGECYPFHDKSFLLLLSDNHNSVNGIREYCRRAGGDFAYTPIQYEDLGIDVPLLESALDGKPGCDNKLFAFPAQSNVSGVKHSLEWIEKAHSKGWDVLLDAAAFVPTSRLNLQEIRPDFVSVSFYKIFGYPTGIGCLLVKKSKFNKLIKPWFAGGTVTLASVLAPHHYLADNHERFENGTINYLDIPAIKIGLDFINSIGMTKINERVHGLADYLFYNLKDIRHDSGIPVANVFGPSDRSGTGGTVIMNFLDSDGNLYEFEKIEEEANKRMISIRSGCFCNPGIDEINNCLTDDEIAKYFSSRDKGDYRDMIMFLKKMRGATRVSVGLATTKSDINTFIDFVESLKNKKIA